jgi:alginate O-acetyltransferase complex protein AlgI
MTLFSFQIYFDFNGYSKIAIGLLKWMGYEIPDNFNHPYLSVSLKEFWKRWHISLSSWLKDYLYIPVTVSLSKKMKRMSYFLIKTDKLIFVIAILTTFLLSSLWHGAAWTFILWGLWLALLIIFERFVLFRLNFSASIPGRIFSWLLVIIQVWIGWVFFRSGSFSQASDIISAMFSFRGGWNAGLDFDQRFFLILAFLPEILYLLAGNISSFGKIIHSKIAEIVIFSFLLLCCIYLRGPGASFIYFQF